MRKGQMGGERMSNRIARKVAGLSMISVLTFTMVACPSSDDQDTEENAPDNDNESPDNESPDNESPDNESPDNESPDNDGNENENESPESG
jgi:hypothetical protein